jgi:hypothetical protein
MTTDDLPMINPSAEDLWHRLEGHRAARREPRTISMSPETWERLSDHALALRVSETELLFDKVPVRLYQGQLGVAIAYTQR